jgi:hypothetical protein
MIRKYIPLGTLEFFDWMHQSDGDGGFIVDVEKDGKTTEEHQEGIAYIKSVLERGQKVRPILVLDNEDGTFQQLDGFKRAWAAWSLGHKYVEAFVCTKQEYDGAEFFDYDGHQMRAWHGGQPHEEYGLFEGGERPNFNYEDTIFLYKSPDSNGLRIEVAETIHVHWSEAGRYRLDLGRRDFEALALSLIHI